MEVKNNIPGIRIALGSGGARGLTHIGVLKRAAKEYLPKIKKAIQNWKKDN